MEEKARFLFIKLYCHICKSRQWHFTANGHKWDCLGCVDKSLTIGKPVQSPVEKTD